MKQHMNFSIDCACAVGVEGRHAPTMTIINKNCRRERLMWDRNIQEKYIRKQVFKLFSENYIILLLLLDYY